MSKHIKSLAISGLRGFADEQTLNLAIPDHNPGSGLTIITGANNTGKSTIFEAFKMISQSNPPGLSEGKRNLATKGIMELTLTQTDDEWRSLKTINRGASTDFTKSTNFEWGNNTIFNLESRRNFSPHFSSGGEQGKRSTYLNKQAFGQNRPQSINNFPNRLFEIEKHRSDFDTVLGKVINPVPDWVIEMDNAGNYYLKFDDNGIVHNSEGIGEGILSVFTLVDAIYDSKPGSVIVIDEPELSLHPSLQKKVANLLLEYSADRQIIITTHCPYFIPLESFTNGSKIVRTTKDKGAIKINELTESTQKDFAKLFKDLNNPHLFGLTAREVFFLDDDILLTEGQEDVIFFDKVVQILNSEGLFNGKIIPSFYGWGIGGADKVRKFLKLLKELGFKKVSVILDKDKSELIPGLKGDFADYHFRTLPTDDIRDKKERQSPAKEGLVDSAGKVIKPEHKNDIVEILTELNEYHS